ncbi:MAG: flagellar hook-basal body complex protein, partial [Planctomycetota bacterium]
LNSSGSSITVPVTSTLPPQATSQVTLQGNLPATVTGPLNEIVQSKIALMEGTAAQHSMAPPPATAPTYDMTSFLGGTLMVSINGKAAAPVTFVTGDFAVNTAATAAEIATKLNTVLGSDVTATGNGGTGAVTIVTTKLGTQASLRFSEGSSSGSSGLLNALGLTPFTNSGTETAATATSNLANLTGRVTAYVAGDGIDIGGTLPDGTPANATFTYGSGAGQNGTTVQDLMTFINTAFNSGGSTGATVALQQSGGASTGVLVLSANSNGPGSLTLSLTDRTSNVGKNLYPTFDKTQVGTGPDQHITQISIFDTLGRSHPVTLTFTRSSTDPKIWDLAATMDPSEGTITSGAVNGITFNSDGSFSVVSGGTSALQFDFAGVGGAVQTVALDFGTSGQTDGIVLTGNKASAAATGQDGYAAGELLRVSFSPGGELTGNYSNGQSQAIDTLRITLFPNEGGLLRAGNTMFVEAPNSDNPIATTAGVGGAGVIRAGSLESSNVDIASEFVKLIEAQRGFQASARVITTTDEVLAELLNIVR